MVGKTVYSRLVGNPAVGAEPRRLVGNRAVPHVSVVGVVGTILIWSSEDIELPGQACLGMNLQSVNPPDVLEESLVRCHPSESG